MRRAQRGSDRLLWLLAGVATGLVPLAAHALAQLAKL